MLIRRSPTIVARPSRRTVSPTSDGGIGVRGDLVDALAERGHVLGDAVVMNVIEPTGQANRPHAALRPYAHAALRPYAHGVALLE